MAERNINKGTLYIVISYQGNWVWLRAGELVDLDAQAWGPNQPDDFFDNEDCLIFEDDFGWNDLRCFLKVTGNGKPNKPLCQKRL